jgi:DNA mismatch repair protein MutL
VALAHPDIKFVMFQNGSEHFNLPKCNYRQRIVNIFGNKTNEKLVPINESTEVIEISGFVGKPVFAKKTRGEQFFFVNKRFVKSAYLNHAISSAFEGLLKEGTHPSYFLNLEVDPQSIDINIHPTKTEIKFDDEHTLYAILRSSVKHSLGQFNIAPVLDFDRDANLDTPYNYKDKKAAIPSVEVDKNFNPFREDTRQQTRTSFRKEPMSSWESLYVGLESKSTKTQHDFSEVQFESDEENTQMFKADKTLNVSPKTFQLHRKYIVNTIKSGILVIDQHKAHQRILYEDFLRHLTVKEAISQQLLFPLKLYFSGQELEIINQLKEDLEHTGFVFSNVNDAMVEISGIPTNVPESEVSVILEQLISDIQNEVPDANFSATDLLAKSMAKSLAIKTGQELTQIEQEHLVNSLFACKEPNVTPNNKVTFVTMTVDELDKKFM